MKDIAGTERWPRQYAADIVRIKDREGRQHALAEVPEYLRSIVECHVRNWFDGRTKR